MAVFVRALPALAWAVLLFLVSHQPTLPSLAASFWDKFLHFGAYAVLGFLLVPALTKSAASTTISRGILAFCLGSAYGASDEFHQAFVPGRSSDVGDWVADTLGAAFGVLTAMLFFRFYRAYLDRAYSRRR